VEIEGEIASISAHDRRHTVVKTCSRKRNKIYFFVKEVSSRYFVIPFLYTLTENHFIRRMK